LLDFEPVPRERIVKGTWSPERQRELIIQIAQHGSLQRACDDMGANRTGVTRLRKNKLADGLNAAIDGAIELARRRLAEVDAMVARMEPASRPPLIDYRRKNPLAPAPGPVDINGNPQLPGQVINEHGEWEDEESYHRRGEEAKDSIAMKLTRIRRLYLQEISGCEGKRAAFEILTELPVDWEKAGKLEPQPFEPWTRTNQRQPDMILTAESGWSFGECGYGPDRKAAARQQLDAHRAEQGLEPIDWSDNQTPSPL
jgi:hypothetical protein